VRVDAFEPAPRLDLAAEYVSEVRWWTQDELARSDEVFAPRHLAGLVRDLLDHGPPENPPALGM
jgi:hypothetical protein